VPDSRICVSMRICHASRDIVAVDLRLNDRVTVRLADGAAAARDEALKAAEKDKKTKDNNKTAKTKGSDA